jgi:molybdate transport system ATP-binding protein
LLEFAAEIDLGAFRFASDFRAETHGIIALFGRSGAGKTTLINILAGLVRPVRGRITLNGAVLFDSAAGIDLPPERRRLGYVFQEGRLFPHLDVRRNLLYGWRRAPPDDRPIGLEKIVDLLDISHLLRRRPTGLSGGEKQRVAIGRALLANPRLLLLDEPLASLDAARKNEVLPFIEQLRESLGLPIVYVSHDLDEIVRLADTMALLDAGRVVTVGPIEHLMGRLELDSVIGRADAGAVLRARVTAHEDSFSLSHLGFGDLRLRVPQLDLPVGAEVRVRVKARDVSLALTAPSDISILNVLPARVAEIGPVAGSHVNVRLVLHSGGEEPAIWARITAKSAHDLRLEIDRPLFALVKAVAIDRDSVTDRRVAAFGSAESLGKSSFGVS